MTRKLAVTLCLCALAALAGCMGGIYSLFPPLDTVEGLDVSRYVGKWYEIQRYPNFFEVGCEGVTAQYTPRDDGTIEVLNICRNPAGEEVSRIVGSATVPDPAVASKLTVTFGTTPFPAPYWVIDLGANYEYAVVGDPSRTFLWILSRTPTLDEATLTAIRERLPEKGYDPNRLVTVPQPSGT